MPQLQTGFEIFANWQTVVFCLALYIVTYVTRTVIESQFKDFATKPLWKELLLPLGPIACGIGFVFIAKKFPWPTPISSIVSAKIMYGAICGLVNGWVYARVRAWFNVAADGGNEFAAKVLKRPSGAPPPMPPGPPVRDRHEGPIMHDQDEDKQV